MPAASADPKPLTLFISHSTKQDPCVRALRGALELRGHTVLEDSTFEPNRPLTESIKEGLDRADRVLALVCPAASASPWVRRELRYAAARAAITPDLHIIPVLVAGAGPKELRIAFGQEGDPDPDTPLQEYPAERLALTVPGTPPRVRDIYAALEARLYGAQPSSDLLPPPEPPRAPVPYADLVLSLYAPDADADGRAEARATLAYYPPEASEPTEVTEDFTLRAPMGPIEADELRWYLERYILTPFGVFTERKEKIEKKFPAWGFDLFEALHPDGPHRALLEAWDGHAVAAERRFTVEAPRAPRSPRVENPQNHPSIAALLSLPWELLNDGSGYLFDRGQGTRVRRSLPGATRPAADAATTTPLRVLIVCARPEEDGIGYIDHRVSVGPLVESLNRLGDHVAYEILEPPTARALQSALQAATRAGTPFHVVHFDGHGVYDRHRGLGKLVFEAEGQRDLHRRKAELVDAEALGEKVAQQGVQLFFLEACQTGQSEQADASVAGRLLRAGVASVAAMSHSVLVETARRFTAAFYPELVKGARVGTAMLEAQRALAHSKVRGWRWGHSREPGAGAPKLPLELSDWFVPILFQHRDDPVLLAEPPPGPEVQKSLEAEHRLAVGKVPPAPAHAFVGRSRELLAAERRLFEQGAGWVLFRGEGGEGKTTLAAELARWLVATRRRARAAFASVEFQPDARAVLTEWGEQLQSGFSAEARDLAAAEHALAKRLQSHRTVLVLDNLESVLPAPEAAVAPGTRDTEPGAELFASVQRVLAAAPDTKLLLTSRERPPESSGFAEGAGVLEVGRLSKREGVELVARLLAEGREHVDPRALEAENEAALEALVDQVGGHARALVLLVPELGLSGLEATTEVLHDVMTELQARPGAGRETSLLASVELGLRRLDPETRAKLRPLAVVQGGGCVAILIDILEVSADACFELCLRLQAVGLADIVPVVPEPKRASDFYLRLDPALGPALLEALRADTGAEAAARARWVREYRGLAGFLDQEMHIEASLAYALARLELPNLVGALHTHAETAEVDPASVVDFAADLESVLRVLHRPKALERVAGVRTQAAQAVEDAPWSPAAFQARRQALEALWAQGRTAEAVAVARALVQQTEVAGPRAYEGAEYDGAVAQFALGRSLRRAGDADGALRALEGAQSTFRGLAKAGDAEAAEMVSGCLIEKGDALRSVGRLEAAATAYEAALERARDRKDTRAVAVGTHQLAMVCFQQRRYEEALRLYQEARVSFEALGELGMVAGGLHQIAMVHETVGAFDAAEEAYLRALALHVQTKNTSGEAATRGQLGHLYDGMPGRREEAAVFFRQAAELYARLGDTVLEASCRNNLAATLLKLERFDDARTALERALELKAQLGSGAEPWKTWAILHDLERASRRPDAADTARLRAVHAYADARRGGWEITLGAGAQLVAVVAQALERGDEGVAEAKRQLEARAAQANLPAYLQALVPVLVRILDGERGDALWQTPGLDYDDAAEVMLLLERLSPEAASGASQGSAPALRGALLEQLRSMAHEKGLALDTMGRSAKTEFVRAVLVALAQVELEAMDGHQRAQLEAAAEDLADGL